MLLAFLPLAPFGKFVLFFCVQRNLKISAVLEIVICSMMLHALSTSQPNYFLPYLITSVSWGFWEFLNRMKKYEKKSLVKNVQKKLLKQRI
jgi:hypothetical protein